MALSTLTYEVPRARRWNTFVVGLAIDLIGLLVLIALGSRLGGQVLVQPMASYHVTLIAPSIEPAPRPAPVRIIPPSPQEVAELETPRIVARPTIRIEPPQPQKIEPPKSELPRPEPSRPELPKMAAFTPTPLLPRPQSKVRKSRQTFSRPRNRLLRQYISRRVKFRPGVSEIPTASAAKAIPKGKL